jgi:hypothetical protein
MPRISKRLVDSAAPAQKRFIIWDDSVKGFGLLLLPSGVKSYVFNYRNSFNRERRITIGKHGGGLTPDTARGIAESYEREVAQGRDPLADKRATRLALSVNDLLDAYLGSEAFSNKAPSTQAVDKGRIEHHLRPTLGKTVLLALTAADLERAHRSIRDGKTAVDKASGRKRGRIRATGGPGSARMATLLEGAFRDDPDAGEKMWLIAEILGAAAFGMATRMPQPKAFVFLGETASNGKSTIASLLSCLLPDGSVSAIKPGDFSDPARIVNLAGKAANVADEISGAVAREMFKAAVTGNVLEGRDLYRSAMTFVPRAIHVFTTNKLPTFNGGLDRGLQRRLVVLTFTRPIPKSEVIADIADRIKRDEMDLLLGFAIAGALRLVRNKAYTEPLSSADALRGWLMMDPIHDWFDATVKSCEDEPRSGWPSVKALFIDFKAWAIDQGHSERNLPTINNFSQRLRSMPGVTIVRRSAGTTAKGITCAFASGL